MSLFSEKLSEYVAQKNIKIYQLSKLSGIERTWLQKMLNGSRKPSSKTQVLHLAQALSLTMEETQELLDLYAILEMGEENWNRRRSVRKLIQSLRIGENPMVVEMPASEFSFPDCQDTVVLSTSFHLNQALHSILLQEACNPSGFVQIQAQPSFSCLINCLSAIEFHQVPIEHYICLNSSPTAEQDNLEQIRSITPLLLNCSSYASYGYYDHISTLFSPSAFLPNLILTSRCMMAISSDYSSALVSRNPELLALCQKHFAKHRSSAWPIFQPAGSFEEYLNVMLLGHSSDHSYCIMDHPCVLSFLTPEILQRVLDRSAVAPETLLRIGAQLSSMQGSPVQSDSCFSLDGLQRFLETGRFTEVPSRYYAPLTPSETHYLLHAICQQARDGLYRMHLMHPSRFEIPPHLCIGALSPQQVTIIFNHPQKGFLAFDVKNLSLSAAIYDFMEYIQTNDSMAYSPEESLQMVEEMLQQASNQDHH